MKLIFCAIVVASAISVSAQRNKPAIPPQVPLVDVSTAAKASPAYAELLLRKTELTAELESLAIEYTDEFPKVRESRYAIALLDRELTRIATIKPSETGKLTLALGKLMLRRIEIETDLGMLQRTYKDDHPDVKRLKKKVEIYDAAIKDILG